MAPPASCGPQQQASRLQDHRTLRPTMSLWGPHRPARLHHCRFVRLPRLIQTVMATAGKECGPPESLVWLDWAKATLQPIPLPAGR